MVTKKKGAKPATIEPGSQAMETLLSAGYPDIATREHAKEILATRKANPALVPWEVAQRAQAFLDALDARPIAIDPEPGRTDE